MSERIEKAVSSPHTEGERALHKLAALCSRSEQCSGSLRRKMQQWNLDPKITEEVLARLAADGFFDDERYTRAYVRDKSGLQGWGQLKIYRALLTKGIPANLIAKALAEEISPETVASQLQKALLNKKRSLNEPNPLKRRAKLIRFGTSRGYAYEAVLQALSSIDGTE